MNYISLQLLKWVYRENDFTISTILCYIFHCKNFIMLRIIFTMLWSNAFFPISWLLLLISVILDHCTWTKFLMVVNDISVNHIFHATAPNIKPLIKVLHVWMKAFLVGLISVIPILVLDLLILCMAKLGGPKPQNSQDSLKKTAATLQRTCKHS